MKEKAGGETDQLMFSPPFLYASLPKTSELTENFLRTYL
jgi:hypothetical protein